MKKAWIPLLPSSAHPTWRWFPLLAFLVVGCSSPPGPAHDILKAFETDAFRADVLVALPVGPDLALGQDDQVIGHPRDLYLFEGAWIEVIWLREIAEVPVEVLDRRDVNPVIFREDRLDGWGWRHFDRRKAEWGIQDRLESEEGEPPLLAPAPSPDAGAPTAPEGDPEGDEDAANDGGLQPGGER